MTRYHFDATWSGETLHENDCMVPWENGDWVRYKDHEATVREQDREIERQRRHRKWVLDAADFQKGRGNRLYRDLKESEAQLTKAVSWQKDRAEKLEKENEELKRMLSVPHN